MEAFSKQTSKLISYWLRHNPEEAGLTVDDFGWASIDHVLKELNTRNVNMGLQDLVQLNISFEKVRWEIDVNAGKIRATHGHSFPVLFEDKAKVPPDELYHGTSVKSLNAIAEKGLIPMNRQFVHLSTTIETALSVGRRHGKPIIIEIETGRLVKDGWKFYQTSDNVWLTADIPLKYLNFRPWFPLNTPADNLVTELKREIGNRHSHFLYPHINKLKAVWKSSASDDVLYQNQETGECYMVHLTYTKKDQEIDGWPHIEKYQTIEEWFEKGLTDDQQYFYDLK